MRFPSAPARRLSASVRFRVCFTLVLLLVGSGASGAERDALKVLAIGNSFSTDATRLLPALASAGGKRLVLSRVSAAGCSLERHALNLERALDGHDHDARVYRNFLDPVTGENRTVTLLEALRAAPWDVVTLQQVSSQSFKRETFQPHLDRLIAAVREYAPTAEILIHQTWAYREDHAFFQNGDGFTAQRMHQDLTANYRTFAEEKNLRLIPVGDAFHLARQTPRWTYVPDTEFDFNQPPAQKLPNQRASLNTGWRWTKGKAGEPVFALDASHCNAAGRYLGAAVWYAILFETDLLPDSYVPPDLEPDDAADLRRHALTAVQAVRSRLKLAGARTPCRA